MAKNQVEVKNNLSGGFEPPKPGLYTKFLLNFFPKTGLARYKAQASVSWLASQGYVTPGSNKRSMRDWYPSGGSADYDTLPALQASRAGSRDLYMNTPVATAVLRRKVTNIIGSGLILQSRIDRDFLGLTTEQADIFERKVEREFKIWSKSKSCDSTRTQTFNELQQLTFLSKILSGDVFVLPLQRKFKNEPYGLALQVIEGDQCQNPQGIPNIISNKVRAGIEIDSFGAPVKYWFKTKHPGDSDLENKWFPIRAYGRRTGRKQVLHIFNKERPGQRRGIPELAPVMEQLKMLTRLSEAELMASVVSSFLTVFIKKSSGVTQGLNPSFAPEESVKSSSNAQDDFNVELAPGAIFTLDEDESIDTVDPKRPNQAFEPFFQAIVKQIGASLEVPFELLMLTFNSSYSASRGAILEGYKTFRKERLNFVDDFNKPIYEEWFTEAVIRGRISAPGFFDDPAIKEAWLGSFWAGPGMGQIDPKKETEASLLRIKGNLSNHETESLAINNGDWDASIDRLARETDKLKERKLSNSENESPSEDNSQTNDVDKED